MAQRVSISGKQLSGLRHVCAFFDSRDEQYDVLGPYLKEGIDNGEQVVTIVESARLPEHAARLEAAGIALANALPRNQLKIIAAEETYLKDGEFTVAPMFEMVQNMLQEASRSEFGCLRTLGDMEWALRACVATQDLLEYEAMINMIAPQHDCTMVCAYDVNRFSGRVVADVLATHSHVLLGGQIQENPHYVEPAEYLGRLTVRRRSSSIGRV